MLPVGPVAPSPMLPVGPASALANASPAARSTHLSEVEVALASEFRPFPRPRTRRALAATLVVCMLLQVIVGAPYAANERAAAAEWLRTARCGLIVGIDLCFSLGPAFVLTEPTLVRGGFHLLYLLSLPITLSAAVGAAYMPMDRDGSTPSFVSIGLLTDGLSILACNHFLNAPLFATDEHKVLQQSLSFPFSGGVMSFFALIMAH
jgi:hypothetical protein